MTPPTQPGAVRYLNAGSRAHTAARITEAIADVWQQIRSHHPQVPDAVVCIMPRKTTGSAGHFDPDRWAPRHPERSGPGLLPEVAVCAEDLATGPTEVLGVLLHEAAHGQCWATGLPDVSPRGYHNRHFEKAAKELGLDCDYNRKCGYCNTMLPDVTAIYWAGHLDALDQALTHYRRPDIKEVPKPSPKKDKALHGECECDPPRSITAAREIAEESGIVCTRCGSLFDFHLQRDDDPADEGDLGDPEDEGEHHAAADEPDGIEHLPGFHHILG